MANAPSEGTDALPRVEAIDRALVLLSSLASGGAAGVSLGALCASTGISKATAYRALSTMRVRGFVAQGTDGNYGLGPQALQLGKQYLGPHNLVSALNPALVALSRSTEELVHLGVWDGSHVVYLDKVEPEARTIRVWSAIGQRVPAASSALGRALLGASDVRGGALAYYVETLPPDRKVTLSRLQEALEQVRSTGFSSELEENEPGVACLGFALVRDEEPVAAISITSIASRMTEERMATLRGKVREVLPPLLPEGLHVYTP